MIEPPISLTSIPNLFWPPKPSYDYWLPQTLRDYIVNRYGENEVSLYIYLFSIVSRYEGNPQLFEIGDEFKPLVERVQKLSKLRFDSSPSVSIIIPVYNNILYTLTSILSILEVPTSETYEIIVADDVSSDPTNTIFSKMEGLIRYIRPESNLGFLHNCNNAAKFARGEFIIFLNNDTITLPEWLDKLIEPMRRDDRIGFTGSKLINGDGTLQEAGGILWKDGSAWNFGRNQDALLPEFNYLKDIDYISGASIAIRQVLWNRLDGFDPIFTPAYCEDSDIAFRVRAEGFRTVYSPHSALVHHEGRTHGCDTNHGIKAYQLVNQKMILKKWQNTLNSENFLNGENVFLARDRSGSKPHILFVDHYVPQWDRDAGSRTIYHYVKLFLDSGFHVTFWPDNLHEDRVYTAQLQELGVEVLYSSAYTGKFDEWSKDNGKYFKYVFLSRPHISMSCIETVRNNFNCIVLYYGHDLHFKRILSQYEVSKDPFLLLEAERFENLELEICNRSDVVLYPSFEEINFFKERLPLKRHLISIPMNVFDEAEIISSEQLAQSFPRTNPYSLVFVGGFSHSPNVDGIIWFVEFVMPLLLKADTRFHLTIAGSNVVSSIKNLASDKISVLGYLSDNDLNELYKTSAMSIVPLRFGGGVKGKVIEAMMRGVPVAMTSIGAQGIPDADLISIVSDDAQDMAKKIIIATIDQSATALRVQKARDFIVNAYSERAAKKTLECVIPEFKLVN